MENICIYALSYDAGLILTYLDEVPIQPTLDFQPTFPLARGETSAAHSRAARNQSGMP